MEHLLSEERTQEVIGLCRDLVRIRSYSGEEQGVAERLREFFASHGFDDVRTDEYGNLIGTVRGNRPGPTVLFDGHMDTVPVDERDSWKHDPFGAEIEDGVMYGRGTSDMKCALACMAAAAAFFAEDTGRDFAGQVSVAGIVHEECFEGIAARAVSRALSPDIVVIGESSDLLLKIGQRGRAEILLETFGVPVHSSNPDRGVNAVYSMLRAVERIHALPPAEHPFLGKGILELTDIMSQPYPGKSVVPAYCSATFDRRLLAGETRESVLAPIRAILDELAEEDPSFRGKVSYASGEETCCTGAKIGAERFFPAWLLERDHPAVRSVMDCFRSHGFEPGITKYSFCTNGSHYCGEAGIPTLGMGPSKEEIAHTVDEHVAVHELPEVTSIYGWMMEALLVRGGAGKEGPAGGEEETGGRAETDRGGKTGEKEEDGR